MRRRLARVDSFSAIRDDARAQLSEQRARIVNGRMAGVLPEASVEAPTAGDHEPGQAGHFRRDLAAIRSPASHRNVSLFPFGPKRVRRRNDCCRSIRDCSRHPNVVYVGLYANTGSLASHANGCAKDSVGVKAELPPRECPLRRGSLLCHCQAASDKAKEWRAACAVVLTTSLRQFGP
jgi:hypothetical protein